MINRAAIRLSRSLVSNPWATATSRASRRAHQSMIGPSSATDRVSRRSPGTTSPWASPAAIRSSA